MAMRQQRGLGHRSGLLREGTLPVLHTYSRGSLERQRSQADHAQSRRNTRQNRNHLRSPVTPGGTDRRSDYDRGHDAWERTAAWDAMNQASSRVYAYEKPGADQEEIGV